MQKAWLESLKEYKTYIEILARRLAEREISIVVIKTDGQQLEIFGLGPILFDTADTEKNSGLIITSDSPADDIYRKIDPLLNKIENGTGGLRIWVSDGQGGSISIPLNEIKEIKITDN